MFRSDFRVDKQGRLTASGIIVVDYGKYS